MEPNGSPEPDLLETPMTICDSDLEPDQEMEGEDARAPATQPAGPQDLLSLLWPALGDSALSAERAEKKEEENSQLSLIHI